MLRAVCPALTAAPCANSARQPRRGQTRIGFVSTHFRNHTIARLNRSWIAARADTLFDDPTVASEIGQAMLRMARESEAQ